MPGQTVGPNAILETLLIKRNHKPHMGLWNGPGGRVENGESTIECLERELKEEIDVTIFPESVKHIATIDSYQPPNNGVSGTIPRYQLKWRIPIFTITEWAGNPKPCDGVDLVMWSPVDNMPLGRMPSDMQFWIRGAFQGAFGGETRRSWVEVFYGDPELKVINRIHQDFEKIPEPDQPPIAVSTT
jgi:ADP-ribose pyrophosphatase YjhB (NUDIX family)